MPCDAAPGAARPAREDTGTVLFEEIDHRQTPMGVISLRRRREPSLQVDVYEARLDDEFLMSSLFTVAEVALARLGLAEVAGDDLDVVVGGLGLGYTAHAALADARVSSVRVVDALAEVIGWHRDRLLPLSPGLVEDPRCALVHGDFFALTAGGAPFGDGAPHRHHAILLDVDHSPSRVLHPSHSAFYEVDGLRRVGERLHPGGVFALWSDDPPEDRFVSAVGEVFATCDAHVVTFANPYTDGEASNTVYVARVEV
ncbi:MAG TPA: spermidine synthase [Acidimicrobiales bacterium]|nr:spermidine synthase [Acidimicrobiales bacterium]